MVGREVEEIIKVYEEGEYPPDIAPKQELSDLMYEICGEFIVWSYGYTKGFEEAYKRNREALVRALIALLERSIHYFEERARLYPSLADVYRSKISKNKSLIERLRSLRTGPTRPSD